MSKNESPFTLNRFEYGSDHIYYLPHPIFEKLEDEKPSFLVGSRGTGKTTLLMALNWREVQKNPYLAMAGGGTLKSRKYVGVYLKLSEADLPTIQDWLCSTERSAAQCIFSFYFDLLWIELVVNAFNELISDNEFKVPVNLEHSIVSKLCKEFLFLKHSRQSIITLYDFQISIREIRRHIFYMANMKNDIHVFTDSYPIFEMGYFGKQFASQFGEILAHLSKNQQKKWHIKICLDEAEVFSNDQQIVFNSVVRTSRFPVFFIASYVALREDLNETKSTSISLQSADRNLIILDTMEIAGFNKLAEGVTEARIRTRLRDRTASLDLNKLLGKLNINRLLYSILMKSESPKAKTILKDAEKYNAKQKKTNRLLPGKSNSRILPIYESYLVKKLELELFDTQEERWQIRRQESIDLRKRNVAAYLFICRELKIKPIYAYSGMLLQLSDNCIRDYLIQMDQIFLQHKLSLREFLLQTEIPIETQDKALKIASSNKLSSLFKSEVTSPMEVRQLVNCLGKITTNLQSDISHVENLKISERGLFIVNRKQCKEKDKDIIDLIQEAG